MSFSEARRISTALKNFTDALSSKEGDDLKKYIDNGNFTANRKIENIENAKEGDPISPEKFLDLISDIDHDGILESYNDAKKQWKWYDTLSLGIGYLARDKNAVQDAFIGENTFRNNLRKEGLNSLVAINTWLEKMNQEPIVSLNPASAKRVQSLLLLRMDMLQTGSMKPDARVNADTDQIESIKK